MGDDDEVRTLGRGMPGGRPVGQHTHRVTDASRPDREQGPLTGLRDTHADLVARPLLDDLGREQLDRPRVGDVEDLDLRSSQTRRS